MIELIGQVVLIGAGLVALAVFTSVLSFRLGAPLLLVFLLLGLVAGEDGIGGIDFDNAAAAYFIGSVALAIILFDSGFSTRFSVVRAVAAPALTLATTGVVLTVVLIAVPAHLLLDLGWPQAALLGAAVSSTDAAAVFFLLRTGGITLRERVRATLEVESGSNDPIAIFLTVALVELIAAGGGETLGWGMIVTLLQQAVVGGLLGLVGGVVIVRLINGVTLEQGLYPLAVMSLALVLFAVATLAGGSGFLAVYVAGILAGNSKLRAAASIRRFQSGMTWLAQITMFLTLGLLATPSTFGQVAVPALLLAVFLILVARPVAVWLCLLPFGFSRNETGFVAWVGLRGSVSILLAALPVATELPSGHVIFNAAFIIVLASLLVQGWTVPAMARRLGQIVPQRLGPLQRYELELPGHAGHELVAYTVHAGSPVMDGERIPRWARPSLIIRDDHTMRLHQAGRLRAGDIVYIFANPSQLRLLDRLFAARRGDDDSILFGDFVVSPDAEVAQLSDTYGFEVPAADRHITLRDLLEREFGAAVEVGDRFAYGPVELIVRGIDEAHRIEEVGLAIDSNRPAAAPVWPRWLAPLHGRAPWGRRTEPSQPADRPPQ